MRRSMLFIPGANPKQLMFAHTLGSDCVIFDLEDAVSPAQKDSARILVRNLLNFLDYDGVEICVRVNSLDSPYWKEDLKEIVRCQPDLIMVPKIESADDVDLYDKEVTLLEDKYKMERNSIKFVLLIESAKGIENCYLSACASNRVTSLALGAEDYTANIQCVRTQDGNEIDYARKRIVNCARAAGVDVYDTPYTNAHDVSGLVVDAKYAKSLGFSGKLSISPRHVDDINAVFSPSQAEVDHAYDVVEAIENGKKNGQGVIALHGKMIDKPVELRALRTIEVAKILGIGRSCKI